MTFLDRYLAGDIKGVCQEVFNLNLATLGSPELVDIHNLLDEIFRRVAQNLSLIHKELRDLGYLFAADSYDECTSPLSLVGDEEGNAAKIEILVQSIKPFILPLSLQYFYKYVSSCDFTWDWNTNQKILWEGGDPIFIAAIDVILDCGITSNGEVWISPDKLVKDNVSGDAYYVQLDKVPKLDCCISHYDIQFIDYLRLTFLNAGFTAGGSLESASFKGYLGKIEAKLLPI